MPTVAERRASLEIISKTPILFIGRLPILPIKTRNKILVNTANKLSKKAFELSAYRLIGMIEFDKKESQKYANSWEQTYVMLRGQFSRFYEYKDLVYTRVKQYRQKHNLLA